MKVAILLLIAIIGATALTPEQKENNRNTNMHHIGNLDELARNCLQQLLDALALQETYVRLGNGIKNGHSVMYQFVEGKSASLIRELAPKYKLKVVPTSQCSCQDCCGRILLPGANIVQATAVPSTRQDRAGLSANLENKELPKNVPASPTAQHLENQKRSKYGLTDEQRKWYYDNNIAQITKMDGKAQLFVRNLIDQLRKEAPELVIQLMAPVPNGHAVRFDLVRGNVSAIQRYAAKCGVQVSDNTIVAPDNDVLIGNAEASAEAEDGHLIAEHPDQDKNGMPEPVKTVPAQQRQVTATLPDKWIKNPTFVEEEAEIDESEVDAADETEEDDAFIQEIIDDDEEEEADAFLLESL